MNTFMCACSSSDNAPVARKLQADDGRMLNVNEAQWATSVLSASYFWEIISEIYVCFLVIVH